MVAVLSVFAFHLTGSPRGGFVGVDVFFVISGFLITGNLLRTASKHGNISFSRFYWNRIRRIVPAATLVLILTWIVSMLVFQPFRAHQVGIDAFFAFIFMSNWRFAMEKTDYFGAYDAISPIQHYWSLSVEEQFYFVWPALIFVISLVVLRKAAGDSFRMRLTGTVMALVIATSFAWAVYMTKNAETWAYFDTFSRVWELGTGALLATAVGPLARIPAARKPLLSWAGLGLIAVSFGVIAEGSVGLPAPWMLLPVAGSALVIAAGVGGEPKGQSFLRNPVSVYIGNISYSLYLVHWPVIVILGSLVTGRDAYFMVTAVAISFGLAIASYHFVENPLRRFTRDTWATTIDGFSRGRGRLSPSNRNAAVAALTLVTLGLATYAANPNLFYRPAPPQSKNTSVAGSAVTTATNMPSTGLTPQLKLGPKGTSLQQDISAALTSSTWPNPLDPTIDALGTNHGELVAGVPGCGAPTPEPGPGECTFGSPTAPLRVVIVGNSVAAGYAGPLSDMALNSGGAIQFHTEALSACNFSEQLITSADKNYLSVCPARKQHAVDFINSTKPDVVIVSNTYATKKVEGTDQTLSPTEWTQSVRALIDKFRPSTKKIVLLAPPPGDVTIVDCYGKRSSTPQDCVGEPSAFWSEMAAAEQELAQAVGGTWIDSTPWFCNSDAQCPSFVGSTVTKADSAHMTRAYGDKAIAAMRETFTSQGIF